MARNFLWVGEMSHFRESVIGQEKFQEVNVDTFNTLTLPYRTVHEGLPIVESGKKSHLLPIRREPS